MSEYGGIVLYIAVGVMLVALMHGRYKDPWQKLSFAIAILAGWPIIIGYIILTGDYT